ncbi:fungal-specific transcription factor domain-containing protein [Mycena floridula]|nr:fungal-specific transcription factor domain-containing protein [Mycena floridula]
MEDQQATKKRRLQGSCDTCKQRKVRCDSAMMPGSVCSRCLTNHIKCTHSNATNSGDPFLKAPFESGSSLPIFTQYRETRAIALSILSPTDQYTVVKDYATLRGHSVEMARYIQALEKQLIFLSSETPASNFTSDSNPSNNSSVPETQELQVEETALVDHLQSLALEQEVPRFHSRSSNAALLQTVINARNDLDGGNMIIAPRRMEYWTVHPWESIHDQNDMAPPLIFPEPDLLIDLVNLTFANANAFWPLFHKPTFDRLIQQGKHLVHREFGMIVLTVCAIGARYSNDPRVFHDSGGQGGLSTGWQYFRQVSLIRSSFMKPTSLYELQLYCMHMFYMKGTSKAESCWITLGIAIRLALDIGLHRKKPNAGRRTVESELWIRVFWTLVGADIYMSSHMGRPRGFNSEEYDQDLPAECDDEYWETEDPALAFKQPPGKPSKVSCWLCYLKLLHIMAYINRTVYSTSTNHPWLNISLPKDNNVVVQIDSALNEWLDAIPDHLKWDPHRQDTFFFDQSAVLYAAYYYVQILLHKPFIGSSPNHSPMESTSFPSLAICANAARSCCHALTVESRRSFLPLPDVMMSIFSSALMLLLNHWRGRRRGFSSNPGREYADVYKCLGILRLYEARWQAAGRFCDVLDQLLEGMQAGPSAEISSLKRPRDLDSEEQDEHEAAFPDQPYDLNNLPALPFHTEELGRLPVYGTFNFSGAEWWQQYAQFNEPPNASGSLAAPNHVQESDLMAFIGPHLPNLTAVMTETVALLEQAEGYSWNDWMSALATEERSNML